MAVHLPKGTRDFLSKQMNARQTVIDTLQNIFQRYGYDALETPAFERIETLTGKYSEDTDKLMYKIHKRGRNATPGECDLGLRYDLTIPLARVVAMHPELRMPFKRYQIQPVWRADRPQKGRFREFYQCDVDIVGSDSTQAEAECLAIITECLKALGFHQYRILLNDRRILSDFAISAGAQNASEELSVLIAIDKLDKIGVDAVNKEVQARGFDSSRLQPLWDFLSAGETDNTRRLDALAEFVGERGLQGIQTLREVISQATRMGVTAEHIEISPTLARGADYYTGPVFELHVDEPKIGSLGGGGRYDELIGMFSGRSIPAVGFAFGLERILVVMEELGMLNAPITNTEVLVTVFSEETREASTRFATALRAEGIATELSLGSGKLKAQLKHANARGYQWVAVIGPDENNGNMVSLKNLTSGTQETVAQDSAHLLVTG